MSEPEHRRAERRKEVFQVLLTTEGPIEIEGQSLDYFEFRPPPHRRADRRAAGVSRESISRSIGPGVSDGDRGDRLRDRAGRKAGVKLGRSRLRLTPRRHPRVEFLGETGWGHGLLRTTTRRRRL